MTTTISGNMVAAANLTVTGSGATNTNSSDKTKFVAYEQFTGLDTSRDVVNIDPINLV